VRFLKTNICQSLLAQRPLFPLHQVYAQRRVG
jgi:hypothetical protein